MQPVALDPWRPTERESSSAAASSTYCHSYPATEIPEQPIFTTEGAARSLPALSIASASRSVATTSVGWCCFRLLVVLESLLTCRAEDLHIHWIRISKAGQLRLKVL